MINHNQTCQFWPHQVSIDRQTAPTDEKALKLQNAAYRCVRAVAFLFSGQWVAILAAPVRALHRFRSHSRKDLA